MGMKTLTFSILTFRRTGQGHDEDLLAAARGAASGREARAGEAAVHGDRRWQATPRDVSGGGGGAAATEGGGALGEHNGAARRQVRGGLGRSAIEAGVAKYARDI